MNNKETVEIRQRTKWIVLFLVVFILLCAVSGYGIFFTEKYKANTSAQFGFVVGILIGSYFMYGPIKKLVKNQPIITFTPDSIILNHTAKTIVIMQTAIQHIDISLVEEKGYVLSIKTRDEDYAVGITWLDTTQKHMADLIERYKPTK